MKIIKFNAKELRKGIESSIRHDWELEDDILSYRGVYFIDLTRNDSPTKSAFHATDWLIHLKRKIWFDEKCEREFLFLLYEYINSQNTGDQKC